MAGGIAGRLAGIVRRTLGKARRRAAGVERKVVTLPPAGVDDLRAAEAAPRALLSYVVDPFLAAEPSHDHTHDFESLEMARALSELGFAVDVIHWTNTRFEPSRPYELAVDVRLNLERLAPLLPERAVKVMHVETAHPAYHNAAQERRHRELAERRGIDLPPNRLIEENRAIEAADCATILGNEFTQGTYAFAGKPLCRVPISNPFLYPSPEGKDFEACRRRFLWFGSGGLVHKGLDRVLEAFAGMPDLELVVCGPVAAERRFEAAFRRELYETDNIRTLGWVDVGEDDFVELARGSLAVVYPSCSEGGGGSVVTCMHAGLIPIVTPETSVDLDPAWGVLLPDASVETIRREVRRLSEASPERLEAMAVGAWRFAREHHTRETFARGYRRAMREILARYRPDLVAGGSDAADAEPGAGADGSGSGSGGAGEAGDLPTGVAGEVGDPAGGAVSRSAPAKGS